MKNVIILLAFIFSLSVFAAPERMMTCTDSEYGAGELKIVIPTLNDFFRNPKDKPMAKAEFFIDGVMNMGVMEQVIFMRDWDENAGWYRARPSMLDFSMCNWKKCNVRQINFTVHTKDQVRGEGTVKFNFVKANGVKVKYNRKLNCEFTVL